MSFLKAHLLETGIFASLIIIFLVTRVFHLTTLPIFTDEAIYIRWAQIAKNDTNWWFISLVDGKGPLFIWGMALSMFVYNDPLFAGRIVSVLAGLLSMIGMFFLGKEVFKNKWIGIISAVLYLMYPMALVYDRMALYDALVGTFAIWSLYFTIRMVRTLQIKYAIALGITIGLSVVNKDNGFLNLYLLPFSLVLLAFTKKNIVKKGIRWVFLAGITTFITYAIYESMRISPLFYMLKVKDGTFIYPFKEWIQHPFMQFFSNTLALSQWVLVYSTIGLLVLYFIGFFIKRNFFREKILLLTWFILPMLLLGLFGKVIYPRYTFPMTLSLVPLAAVAIYTIYEKIKVKIIALGIVGIFLFLAVKSDYLILSDFTHSLIPKSDLNQYYNDWPSGVGVPEAVTFFQEESKNHKIFIGTEGTFGLMPYALEIYFKDNPNVTVKGYWPVNENIPSDVLAMSKKMPTYFLFYQPCPSCMATGVVPQSWSAKKVLQVKRPAPNHFLSVYQIVSEK